MRRLTRYIRGFYMSLGMFCGIPLPFFIWDEALMPEMVASLPLIGLLTGAIWGIAGLALSALRVPSVLTAAFMTVAPFFIAGFIHLDGYMDTCDAMLSRRPLEERRRILKDSNVGAFAVVMLAILFLLQFAAMYTAVENGGYIWLLAAICASSRCCAALAIFSLKHMPDSGYAAMLGDKRYTGQKYFLIAAAIIIVIFSVLYAGPAGLITSAATFAGSALALRSSYKNFEGVSGDLLGFSIVAGELCGVLALAFCGYYAP